jgi:hypothetical protein
MIKKIVSGFLVVLGYLLSPLCWWNDLIFNLPIAYCFGRLGSVFSPDLFLPFLMLGYWLSNLVGILLIQFGAFGFFQDPSQERHLKKDLLTGLASSTVYTVVILVLLQLNIFDTSSLFSVITK